MLEIPGSVILFTILIHGGRSSINAIYRQFILSLQAFFVCVPADFSKIEEDPMAFDPESGEFLLGDIVISMDKVWEQAENYGHSREREYAFLIAHSMLHLFGYDHMEEEERKDMEKRQEEILTKTKYTRDERGLV